MGTVDKQEILNLVAKYSQENHGQQQFVPGKTVIPYAGRVFADDEVVAAVDNILGFWLTLGDCGQQFESRLANTIRVRSTVVTNSGSSANLLAMSALTSHKIPANRRLNKGDEVITAAAGFPTTVGPIVQCGAVPVFVDVNPITGNIDTDMLEEAYSPGLTKAVILAHTLGNPFDIKAVSRFCENHDLWLIEDNCDSLGSTYFDGHEEKQTGAWGDLSTQSFYPPHHITMGEGGAVNVVRDARFRPIVESFRDWGRDCWCKSGQDDTCNKRFGWQLGDLPAGYDHKYIYSHIGYNLKPLDMQAAIGCVQLNRLPSFVDARRKNWQYLRNGLDQFSECFEFTLPTHAVKWLDSGSFEWDESGCKCDPSWFGFMIYVRDDCHFSRTELAQHLSSHKIGNRMLFGGNLTKQPAYMHLKQNDMWSMRTVGNLTGSDKVMEQALFIGVYPGLTTDMLDYVISVIGDLCNSSR